MDFLKNITSGISGAVNKVGSFIGGAVNSVVSSLQNNPASAAALGPLIGPNTTAGQYAQSQKSLQQLASEANAQYGDRQTIRPNMSTIYGPAYANPSGNVSVLNPNGTQNAGATGALAINSAYNISGSIRPAITNSQAQVQEQARTDQFGRVSNSSQGNPYYVGDKLVIPQTGFSGLSGSGGSGGSGGAGFSSTPATMQGTQGGGGSAFTGLLSGVGSTGGSSTTSDEQQRLDAQKKDTRLLSPQTAGAVNNIVNQPKQPLNAPAVPNVIDASYLQEAQKTLNSISSAGSSLSEVDKQTLLDNLAQNLVSAKSKLDQQYSLPTNPVEDTAPQLEFINTSEDPFGVKQAIDAYKMANTDLGSLLTTRVELMKNVQALNQAYAPIIKDIKTNPDLPKALSRRRLEDLAVTQKETLQGFLDQLSIVNQQVSDQNEMVDRAFNIVTNAQSQTNKNQDNMRANLQLMINSGAIAGFNQADIQNYSRSLGVSPESLKSLRESALNPKQDIITNEDANGNLVALDKNTGKIVWSQPGFAKVGTGSTEKNLSVSDVKALRELYPDIAGSITINTTRSQVERTLKMSEATAGAKDDILGGITDRNKLKQFYPELSLGEIDNLLVQNIPASVMPKKSLFDSVGGFFSSLFGK